MEAYVKSRETRPQLIQSLLAALPPLDPSLEEFRDVATLPDGYEIDLQIVRPRGVVDETSGGGGGGRPLILLWSGGGFIVAGVEPVTRPAREFALEFGAVVVNATYRLAPENKFPRSVRDGYETAVWLSKNAGRFGADVAKGFVLGGYSAGANIAAVVGQRSGVEGLGVTGTMLGIPLLLTKEIVPEKYAAEWVSREENATWSPTFTSALVDDVLTAGLAPDVRSPWFSPVNDPAALPKCPRAYIQVGDRDPLRDDGLVYAKMLRDNGVEARVDRYPDWGHQGWSIYAPADSPARLGPDTIEGMRWLLGKE
ncbi:alpha/beta-hydrolase [Colletotrichum somersetense]|nr:alpha/beta-hydrolase [Colletotrichum somersetense]